MTDTACKLVLSWDSTTDNLTLLKEHRKSPPSLRQIYFNNEGKTTVSSMRWSTELFHIRLYSTELLQSHN